MQKLYVRLEGNLYTEFEIPTGKSVTVPSGWEKSEWSWEEAQDNGYVFMKHTMAGFALKDSIEQTK